MSGRAAAACASAAVAPVACTSAPAAAKARAMAAPMPLLPPLTSTRRGLSAIVLLLCMFCSARRTASARGIGATAP